MVQWIFTYGCIELSKRTTKKVIHVGTSNFFRFRITAMTRPNELVNTKVHIESPNAHASLKLRGRSQVRDGENSSGYSFARATLSKRTSRKRPRNLSVSSTFRHREMHWCFLTWLHFVLTYTVNNKCCTKTPIRILHFLRTSRPVLGEQKVVERQETRQQKAHREGKETTFSQYLPTNPLWPPLSFLVSAKRFPIRYYQIILSILPQYTAVIFMVAQRLSTRGFPYSATCHQVVKLASAGGSALVADFYSAYPRYSSKCTHHCRQSKLGGASESMT